VIDEAARVPDDLYRAVCSMLAVRNGRLICLANGVGLPLWPDPAALTFIVLDEAFPALLRPCFRPRTTLCRRPAPACLLPLA
jgi:hypothetical protein